MWSPTRCSRFRIARSRQISRMELKIPTQMPAHTRAKEPLTVADPALNISLPVTREISSVISTVLIRDFQRFSFRNRRK